MAAPRTLITVAFFCSLAVFGQADPCAPDCHGSSDLFPHPQDCTSFYQCSYGTAFLQHCPATLEFSPTGLRCDYPAQAGCRADPTKECSALEPSQKPGPTAAARTTQEANKCTPSCPTPEALYPHPHDCTKYFHCARNVPYLKSCPVGQEYSGPLYRCDYPDIAKCAANVEAPCQAVTYAPTTPSSSQSCTPKCPHDGAYMPHPQDCTKFYICSGLVAFEASCQSGLYYNMKFMWCDYPANTNCIANPDRACDEYLSPP